jgi:transcriptional regulator with XRE-family HTH domain
MLQRIIELIGYKHGEKKKLADNLGISQNVFTSWFAGKSESYKKYAPIIADYFDVSVDYLSGKTDDKNKKSATLSDDGLIPKRQNLVHLLTQLSDDDAALAEAYMQALIDSRKP